MLDRLVRADRAAEGLTLRVLYDSPSEESGASSSDWVLIAASAAPFEDERFGPRLETIEPRPELSLWTDRFNNLIDVLKARPLESLRNWLGLE